MMIETTTIFSRLDRRLQRFVRSRYSLACLLLVCVTLLQYGVGIVPREFYRVLAWDPYVDQKEEVHKQNYFQESPLLPIVAHHLCLFSRFSFNLFCLIVIMGAYVLFAFYCQRRIEHSLAFSVFALLQAHPATTVLLSWLGMPDCITFTLTVLALFITSLIGLIPLCILGAFNHPVALFAIPAVLVLRRLAKDKGVTWWHPVASALALGLGLLAIQVFLCVFNIKTYSRVDHALSMDLKFWINQNVSFFPMVLFSLHNIVWLAIGVCIMAAWRFNRLYFIVFALTQLGFYAITFFCLDTTRVFSLLAWAPAVHCIIYSCRLLREQQQDVLYEQTRKLLLLLAMIGMLIPNYYVYLGIVHHPLENEFHIWSYLTSLIH